MPASYEELAGKMRVEPTFAIAEEVIKKDFKLKLPSRTAIHIWNSPEISQFRGYQEELDSTEDRKHNFEREQAEIHQAARGEGVHVPDMNMVGEAIHHQNQSASALRQHLEGLREVDRREAEGRQAEYRAELERLGVEARMAANRDMIARGALDDVRDHLGEHRNMLGQLAQSQGLVTNYIDQSAVHNHYNQHMVDQSIHDEAMHLMHTNAERFGQYMQQQNMNQEQVLRALYAHLAQQRDPQQPIIHYMHGYGGGPPPGGAGGAIAIAAAPAQQQAAAAAASSSYGMGFVNPRQQGPPTAKVPPIPLQVAPTPVATVDSSAVQHYIGTPRPASSIRAPSARVPTGRARGRPRKTPETPWNSGGVNPPAMPANEITMSIRPASRSRSRSKPPEPAQVEAEMPPSGGPPPPPGAGATRKASREPIARPKAKAKSAAGPMPARSAAGPLPAKARSTSARTVAYRDAIDTSVPRSRSRGRSTSIASVAETIVYNQGEKIAPAPEAAPKRGRGRPRKDSSISASSLAAGLKASTPAEIQVEQRVAPDVPSAAAPKKKPRIRTVSLGATPQAGELTLPIARKPRKKANVTLPTTSYVPLKRGKGKGFRGGVPYGSKNKILAAEGKQLIDESNEFLNVPA